MTYLIKQNKPKFFSKKIWFAIIVLILVSFVLFVAPLRDILDSIFSPVFQAGGSFSTTVINVPDHLKSKSELLAEVRALGERLEQSRIDRQSLEALTFENKSLRESLSLRPAAGSVSTEVVARPPQIPFDTLLLDRGENDGLKTGSLVLLSDHVVLGKLGDVRKSSAIVVLNSFGQVSFSGSLTRTEESLEVKGIGGGMLAEVPTDFDIQVGDTVIVQAHAPLVAAVVGSIEEDKSSGRKRILLSLPVPVSNIRVVFVKN